MRVQVLLSKTHENQVLESLKKEYPHIYSPSAVCDAIVVVDGEAIFIEIKKKGQQLRPAQKDFRDKIKNKYLVIT